jgi:hypothetical protein
MPENSVRFWTPTPGSANDHSRVQVVYDKAGGYVKLIHGFVTEANTQQNVTVAIVH